VKEGTEKLKFLIIGIVAYLILGICYAINYFHDEYENTVENDGVRVGEFFAMTIIIGLWWPIFIVMFAVMDLRDER